MKQITDTLRNRPMRRLLAALAVSGAGDWLYNVALLALVYDRTHAAAWVAVTTAARVLPIVVIGPFGGIVADRYDRRTIMIASDLIRAAAMVALALVTAAGLPIVLAPVLAALATAAAAPYPPCVAVATPHLVGSGDLAAANALRSTIGSVCIVVGPAIGGLLLLVASPALAFVVNATTFAASAVLVAGMHVGAWSRPSAAKEGPDGEPGSEGRLVSLLAGLTALRRSPMALRLVGADLTCSVVYGAQTVMLLLVSRSLGQGSAGYGWLLTGCGLGGIVGAAIGGRMAADRTSARRSRLAVPIALVVVAITLPALALVGSLAAAVVLTAVGGAGAIAVEVMTDTGLQRLLDPDVLGRAYGFSLPAALGGIVIGSLAAGPAVDLLGLHNALIALGGLVAGHALWLTRPATAATGPAPVSDLSVA